MKAVLKLALEALESMKETLAEHDEPTTFNEDQAITAIKEALAQPEQEHKHIVQSNGKYSPLLTHMMNKQTTPPKEQPKPLTLNEMTAIEEKVYMQTTHKGKPSFEYAQALTRAVEAAHGIKGNT